MIDGMRHAASHIDTYKPHLSKLRPEAIKLIDAGETAIKGLSSLIGLLAEPKMPLARVRELQRIINDAESTADHLEFIAWDKFYQLIEEMTDDAKRCGKLILSLARKEA